MARHAHGAREGVEPEEVHERRGDRNSWWRAQTDVGSVLSERSFRFRVAG